VSYDQWMVEVDEVRPDLERMRRERRRRLAAEMERQGLAALLLTGTSGVHYAVGDTSPVADASHLLHEPCTALVLSGDELPHLFTPFPEQCPPELRGEHCHPPLTISTPKGVASVAATVQELAGKQLDGPLAIDEAPSSLYFGLFEHLGVEIVDAAEALGAAKVIKTPDEIECIQQAQRINEAAMYDVLRMLRPGVRQSELTGTFLRRIFELGATGNCVDPIFQPMPATQAAGPYTVNGAVAFPLCSNDRMLAEGDVIWVDSGIDFHGYASDFGTTWIVGRHARPTERQRGQFRRWKDVVDATLEVTRPGATGADLTAAAIKTNGGTRPWLDHFYLIHGLGTFSAEMPLIGSDLGPAFDESLVLAPGMLMVLEPVAWDEGAAGYRFEEVLVVTDDGYRRLSAFPYTPYE
jgi:Xaa-Pro dipeptidase